MSKKVSNSIARPTVIAALATTGVLFVSLFFIWMQSSSKSVSWFTIILESLPTGKAKNLPMLILTAVPVFVGILVVVLCFLFNRPKLSLIGQAMLAFNLVLLLVGIGAAGGHIKPGFGLYIYAVCEVLLLILTFATKKIKVEEMA